MSDHGEQSYANWVLRFAGASIAIAYSLGFLVVARHLSRYEVSTFSLLQTQYLVAGIWTVTPPILFAVVQRTMERFRDTASRFPISTWRQLFVIPAVTGIPFGLLIGTLSQLLGGFEGFSWKLFARMWFFYLLLSIPADLAWMSWKSAKESERWYVGRHALPLYLTVLCLGILAYASNFATMVYPLIPYSLGGGKPRTIVFIPGKDGLPVGIARDNVTGRSTSYKLLTETDKSYVVISPTPNEESIEIGRDTVHGIVVLKESVTP
jgi:hypothetical protein